MHAFASQEEEVAGEQFLFDQMDVKLFLLTCCRTSMFRKGCLRRTAGGTRFCLTIATAMVFHA